MVTISAPTGANPVQATATAVVNASGNITAVVLTNAGSGYTAAPTITISASGAGTLATAQATLDSVGSGYIAAPLVAIAPPGSNATATATISGGTVAGFTITNGGSGYLSPPVVNSPAAASPPPPRP